MSAIYFVFLQDLNNLAALIRTDLTSVVRKILIALITIDVHARDTISNMVNNKIHTRYVSTIWKKWQFPT